MIKKHAFTLAEVMIVFVVVGVLTAILLPGIFAASPEQEVLKAKKAFNTVFRAVESLTNSGPYDTMNGILDATAFIQGTDATAINSRKRFFCNNLSNILNVKQVDCSQDKVTPSSNSSCGTASNNLCMTTTSGANATLNQAALQDLIDETCDAWYANVSEKYNFVTADNVFWGVQLTDFNVTKTLTVDGITSPAFYGVICFDTAKHQSKDRVYGMGVRKDGKVIAGTKLQTLIDDEEN